MHLKANIDIIDFLKTIKKCNHDVYFVTAEGDRLNLSSQLSEYIFLAATTNPELISHGLIEPVDTADFTILRKYLEE